VLKNQYMLGREQQKHKSRSYFFTICSLAFSIKGYFFSTLEGNQFIYIF